jgi:choline monooxygenase
MHQEEDTALCEDVQAGLDSPAYGAGRYAPRLEHPMFHFHQQLNADIGPNTMKS